MNAKRSRYFFPWQLYNVWKYFMFPVFPVFLGEKVENMRKQNVRQEGNTSNIAYRISNGFPRMEAFSLTEVGDTINGRQSCYTRRTFVGCNYA